MAAQCTLCGPPTPDGPGPRPSDRHHTHLEHL